MSTATKETTYSLVDKTSQRAVSLIKLGVVATASVALGGMAAAWYYRDTLKKLQNPVRSGNLPDSESPDLESVGSDLADSELESDVYDADHTISGSGQEFDASEPGTLPSKY